MNWQALAHQMDLCEQTKGQTVMEHGQSVLRHFEQLTEEYEPRDDSTWRLPEWFKTKGEQIQENCHLYSTIISYLIYHDCGKPFCREVDEAGKVHFADHANVSKRVFLETWPDNDQKQDIANLIGWDMVLHTASSEEIDRYCREEWSVKDACTLLLAALCEVHSNARLFGGIESISFKSKWKQLDRRGKQICKHYFGESQ